MTDGTPEALTAKGMTKDVAASVVFLLGTALIEYIKRHFQVESGFTGTFLLLSELTLIALRREMPSRSELPLGRVFIPRWTNRQ